MISHRCPDGTYLHIEILPSRNKRWIAHIFERREYRYFAYGATAQLATDKAKAWADARYPKPERPAEVLYFPSSKGQIGIYSSGLYAIAEMTELAGDREDAARAVIQRAGKPWEVFAVELAS